MQTPQPILVAHLFQPLNDELIALLRGFSPDEWNAPTVVPGWNVHDIAAHLLDSALRRLSAQRDGYALPIDASADLATNVNSMNNQFVAAARRLSPAILIDMLELYGRHLSRYLQTFDPYAPAAWAVSWAGDETSPNWFDVARELTERWHHQQQIRDATGRPPLYESRFFDPVIDTFMRALPFTYRGISAPEGTAVRFEVTREGAGSWSLVREGSRWVLGPAGKPDTVVSLTGDTAWRLFTKGLDRRRASERISIAGDRRFGEPFIQMLCIIA